MRLRQSCGLMANDQGDMLIVECMTIHRVVMPFLFDLIHYYAKRIFYVERIFGDNAWEKICDLPRLWGMVRPVALDAIFAQHGLCPVPLLTRSWRRVLLTYEAPRMFSVVRPEDAYQHHVMFLHDTVPEKADEIAEWLASNMRSDYQQIATFKREHTLLLSGSSVNDLIGALIRQNNNNLPVHLAGPDHFPASLFCFENVNDAILFKLRWIG